ncbi:MAG TPA: WD40 repeat domain-containing protein [Planctomycetaceae bacterium]
MNCPRCGGELKNDLDGQACGPCSIVLPPRSAAIDILCRGIESAELSDLLESPVDLLDMECWDDLEALLLAPAFWEAKVGAGMVFELAEDFAMALERLPKPRQWRRLLTLLHEALLRDLHFINRHPGALFQCLWNSCWWYDCPEAAGRYDPPESGWCAALAPWDRPGPKLSPLMEAWRQAREVAYPGYAWLRSLRPPQFPLGSPARVVIPVNMDGFRFLDLRFSSDGRRIFAWLNPVGTADVSNRQFRSWSAESGCKADFAPTEVPSHDPCLSPDGRWRVECGGAGGGWGESVRVVDVSTGRLVASLPTDEDVNIQDVQFSSCGQRIVGGGWGDEGGGEAMVWDIETRERLAWLRAADSVFAVAISAERKIVATGNSRGEILLWDLESSALSATLKGHEHYIESLAFSADSGRLASAANDGTVRIWDLSQINYLPRLRDHPHGANGIEFSEDGSRMLTFSSDHTAWLWNACTGAPIACLNDRAVCYLMGGPPMQAAAIRGHRVLCRLGGEIWDAMTGAVLRSSSTDSDSIARFWSRLMGGRQTVWSPDGSKVAGYECGKDATISSTSDLHAEPLSLHGLVEAVAFSPDSRLLVTGSSDWTVRVWDAGTGAEVACLRGHEQAVSCVAFSPDGRFVASGAADRTVRVWDVTNERASVRIDIDEPGIWRTQNFSGGHPEELRAARAVEFTHGGDRLVTDCGDRFCIWDIRTGTLVRTIEGRGNLEGLAAELPLQGIVRGSELVIENDSSTILAHIPAVCGGGLVSHPSGRIWAVGGIWPRLFELCGPAAATQ